MELCSSLEIGLVHLITMPPGLLKVFPACPTGRRPWNLPKTLWKHYISSHIGVPQRSSGVSLGRGRSGFLTWTCSFLIVISNFACSCRYFPFEEENNHTLVKEIGNVTKGLEITFQFAVKPDFKESKFFKLS